MERRRADQMTEDNEDNGGIQFQMLETDNGEIYWFGIRYNKWQISKVLFWPTPWGVMLTARKEATREEMEDITQVLVEVDSYGIFGKTLVLIFAFLGVLLPMPVQKRKT